MGGRSEGKGLKKGGGEGRGEECEAWKKSGREEGREMRKGEEGGGGDIVRS